MSELRDEWRAAKNEVKGNLVLSDEMEKLNLGPLLDAVVEAEEAYDAVMEKLAKAPDEKKEKKAKDAVLKAIGPASKAAGLYLNGVKGIAKARPDQAASAERLGGVLTGICNSLEKTRRRIAGR